MRLVLLHSPLVGPSTWKHLTPALEALGHAVVVPDYAAVMRGDGPFYPAIIETIRTAVGGTTSTPTAFVAHSGAGALIPYVLNTVRDFAIFVDALLPHPGRSWFDTAPPALKERLTGLAQNGRVLPWHLWWPKGAIEALLGSRTLFDEFTAEAHDLSLAYFTEAAPADASLPASRCAFLQTSEAYGLEADTVEAQGWLTRRLSLNHLAVLTNPNDVGVALNDIVTVLGSA